MVLTRAQNQPGPDGTLGDDPSTTADESADDVQDANNTDSPWVDQSQTYTSHPSHQVFLREYALNGAGRPVATGKLLGGTGNRASGMATWADVKAQAATKLGLHLVDRDVLNIPLLATDPYGKFIPGPLRGLPQYVTATGLVEGNIAAPVAVPSNVKYFDTPFLTDIAHNADPSPQDTDNDPNTPAVAPTPDADNVASADFKSQTPGTYDDEMLDAHFSPVTAACNENIALTTIHQVFHSEHDRLVDYMKAVLSDDAGATASGAAALADWKLPTATNPSGWNGERLFQAARFVTEMEYQHLVFEEFARKVQPAVRPFHVYSPDINPAIPAEFAHAVYRFGHSMLDDQVARTNENGSRQLDPAADGLPQPARVPPQRRLDVHARAGGGRGRHGLLRPGRQRARRVRHRDAAQQPARPAARPADAQHGPRPRRRDPAAEPGAPGDLRGRPTTASWRRTRAGRTSASTSSTPSRWSTSSPPTARTRRSPGSRRSPASGVPRSRSWTRSQARSTRSTSRPPTPRSSCSPAAPGRTAPPA